MLCQERQKQRKTDGGGERDGGGSVGAEREGGLETLPCLGPLGQITPEKGCQLDCVCVCVS